MGNPGGQADIIVSRIQGRDLAAAAARTAEGRAWFSPVLSTRNLPSRPRLEPRCRDPSEVISRDEMGPDAYEIVTDLLCRIGNDRFLVSLRYWEGDRRARRYRAALRAVAGSLRFDQVRQRGNPSAR